MDVDLTWKIVTSVAVTVSSVLMNLSLHSNWLLPVQIALHNLNYCHKYF